MPDESPVLSDQGTGLAVIYIAKCAEHGLHGERDECYECGKPVEHVTYVRGDMHLQVAAANGRKAEDLKRLRAENEALKAAIESAVNSLSWTQCPAYKCEGTCISGCHQEPICQTGAPLEGWDGEALKTLAAVLEDDCPAFDENGETK